MRVKIINPRFNKNKLYHLTTEDRLGSIMSKGLIPHMSGTNDSEHTPNQAIYFTNDPVKMIENDPNFIKDDLVVLEVNRKGIKSEIIPDDEYLDSNEPYAFYSYSDVYPHYIKVLGRLEMAYDKNYDGVSIRQHKLFPIEDFK